MFALGGEISRSRARFNLGRELFGAPSTVKLFGYFLKESAAATQIGACTSYTLVPAKATWAATFAAGEKKIGPHIIRKTL